MRNSAFKYENHNFMKNLLSKSPEAYELCSIKQTYDLLFPWKKVLAWQGPGRIITMGQSQHESTDKKTSLGLTRVGRKKKAWLKFPPTSQNGPKQFFYFLEIKLALGTSNFAQSQI